MAEISWDDFKDLLTKGANKINGKSWEDIKEALDDLKELINEENKEAEFKQGCVALGGTVPSNEKWDCLYHGTRLFWNLDESGIKTNQESGDLNEESDPESGSMAIHVRVIPMA